MAALTTTISESMNVFGPEPTNKWGTVLWGENWGIGDEDLETNVFKTQAETVSISDSITKVFNQVRSFSESFGVSDSLQDLNLRDSSGYYRNFTLPTDDAEDRAGTSYSTVASPGSSWTEASEPSTDWTDA